jgi:hypothetical protein
MIIVQLFINNGTMYALALENEDHDPTKLIDHDGQDSE